MQQLAAVAASTRPVDLRSLSQRQNHDRQPLRRRTPAPCRPAKALGIQTREGADLSHFYASILSQLRAPQAVGWRNLSRASEQVDHFLDSLKPRLFIFDEFHSTLRGSRQDVKAIFSLLRRIARVHDSSPVFVGEIAINNGREGRPQVPRRAACEMPGACR